MATRKKAAKRSTYHHGDLQAELVAAATALVEKHGSSGFSLREAARSVGVDAAACYRHFSNRQEVLVVIGRAGFLKLAASFSRERARAKGAPAIEQLGALARAYVAFARRYPAEFRVMFGDSGLDSRDARLRAPELQESAYQQLEQVVHAYAQEQALRTDEFTLALSLWGVAHGIARLALDGAVRLEDAALGSIVESAVTALVRGWAR